MLHLFSFLLRAVAIVNVLMFPFVYVVAQFVATTYAIPMGFFMPNSLDPTPFIAIFAGYWTILWIIFACIGVYALAQFIDLQITIGHALAAARRRRQQAEQHQQAQQFQQSEKYQGYDGVPEDGNWASLPERPGSSSRLLRPDEEEQRRNVWTSRL
ncbi:MAG: hypothetical protein IH587_03280 [Anaerolineae bacterium]|nr:hypothetical protein [Anaerolineae bacterium]